jgi:hypothetical protein
VSDCTGVDYTHINRFLKLPFDETVLAKKVGKLLRVVLIYFAPKSVD